MSKIEELKALLEEQKCSYQLETEKNIASGCEYIPSAPCTMVCASTMVW